MAPPIVGELLDLGIEGTILQSLQLYRSDGKPPKPPHRFRNQRHSLAHCRGSPTTRRQRRWEILG